MKKKIIIAILIVAMLGLVTTSFINSYQKIIITDIDSFRSQSFLSEVDGNYNQYLKDHSHIKPADAEISINPFNPIFDPEYSDLDTFSFVNDGIITQDEGRISYQVDVLKAGFYNLEITYEQVVETVVDGITFLGKSSEIERKILIDGVSPFLEAESIKFSRIWEDDFSGEFATNHFGDQIRPTQVEKIRDVTTVIGDYDLKIVNPYQFYLEEGVRILTFEGVREPLIIKEITFTKVEEVLKYDEQLSLWKETGLDVVENEIIWHEAEYIHEKGSPVLIPLTDNTSPKARPYNNGNKQKLNVVGVYSWRLPGYWISYEIDVETEGLYQLTIRGKQDIKESSFVSRQIKINGVIPYEEASYIPFMSSGSLNNYTLGTQEEPYLFHLKKGTNIVELKVSLGNVGELISETQVAMEELNYAYLNIIKYTSVNPQKHRDYQIEKNIPSLRNDLEVAKTRLENVVNTHNQISGGRQGQVSVISTLIRQLEGFLLDLEGVVHQLNSFQSNISALGTWVLNEQEQPFTMDSLVFHSPDSKLPRAKENFFEMAWQNILRFVFSFSSKNSFSGVAGDKNIRVWVLAGRDNAQILRRIIDEANLDFSVDLELVPADALLRATVSGQGPDVVLMAAEGTPIDFAFRSAAYDLTNFSDYDEISTRFYDSANEPFKLVMNGHEGVYALPEQQTFPVLFYRSDIFDQLEITPPETWDDLYNVLNVLNNNNLDFFLESGSTSLTDLSTGGVSNAVNTGLFTTLLYQHQGEYYDIDKTRSDLTSPESMQAFMMFTKFFTSYQIPTQANFVNRFRSGEMAAGITDYQTYNTLVVFAPEISGKWAVADVPRLHDGPGGDVVSSKTTSSSMILQGAEDKETSWEFLKWWTSTETQVNYAKELETIMGAAARYTTANREALERLSWPTRDLRVILRMMEKARGVPQVPGGYMTTRQFTYAFLSVVNDSRNPYETLNEYVEAINREITKKRKEFDLD